MVSYPEALATVWMHPYVVMSCKLWRQSALVWINPSALYKSCERQSDARTARHATLHLRWEIDAQCPEAAQHPSTASKLHFHLLSEMDGDTGCVYT